MAKRTNIDFSKHELQTISHEGVLIHVLKIPGTNMNCFRFINTQGILAVTGDYGNWIFCREFHPSKKERVSDGYWVEKLGISSEQDGREWDEEGTKAQIKEMLYSEEYSFSGNIRDYLYELLNHLDDGEQEYVQYAYWNNQGLDYESIPFVKRIKYQLLGVFDAFDEICERQPVKEPVTA
jgi:hypothetical protein